MTSLFTNCKTDDSSDRTKETAHSKINSTRHSPSFRSVSISKKNRLKEDREFQIYKDNQILLKKMILIDTKPLKYFKVSPSPCRQKSRLSPSIEKENESHQSKLRNATSHYSANKYMREENYRQYLKSNISKMPKKTDHYSPKLDKNQILIQKYLKRREQRLQSQVPN